MNPLQPSDLSDYLAGFSAPEQELLRLFRSTEGLVIFDIGACEGEDSVRYARRFPHARIYSFEPRPDNQAFIRANFERYRVCNAELIPVALSDCRGDALFHVSSGHPNNEFAGKNWNYGNKSSSLLPPAQGNPMYGWVEFNETIAVRTVTLDDFCRERGIDQIDFIQMDVQGAEHLVLQGARTMLPKILAVWLEVSEQQLYEGQKLRADTEAFMHARGFALAFEERRQIEGDQFYVNIRLRRGWRYFRVRRLRNAVARLRGLLGRIKHALRR